MKITRREALGALAAAPAALAQLPPVRDPLLKLMLEEIERSAALKAVSSDPLYYLEYALDDMRGVEYSASLGGLLTERRVRVRIPRVVARIGSPEFDNTNHIYSGFYSGSRFDPEQFPLDDDSLALRRAFWLATDRAVKGAIEAIGRKRAALRNVTETERLPDFSPAPPARLEADVSWQPLDEAAWRSRTMALSAIFRGFPEIQDSSVDFYAMQSRAYLATSDGTAAVFPEPVSYVMVRASTQARDGMPLRASCIVEAHRAAGLPAEAELRRRVTKMAEDLRALTKAPPGDAYSGPVLFEGEAGPQLLAEILGSALPATRRPIGQPGQQTPYMASAFEGRLGSRVMPEGFTVVDDPTLAAWKGRPLLGHYPLDAEGVVPRPLTVIEDGTLKAMLATRQPTRVTRESNGRARVPGNFGAKAAGISNLIVKAPQPKPVKELRDQLLRLAAERGKGYGIVVRQMDFPSTASLAELRRIAANTERPVSLPLLTYRLYPDGREELIRGLRFRGLGARSLRDILGAGDDGQPFDFLGSTAPFAVVGGAAYVYPASVVAPSLLFDDLELERMDQDLPQLPVAPPPPLTD
jgi:TldD protein